MARLRTPFTSRHARESGPGEAKNADYGLAGGMGEGVLFKKGEIVGKASEKNLTQALLELIKNDGIE